MKISVLIPTYRRPQDLNRCLEALGKQEHCPLEVLVIVRDSDQETQVFLQNFECEHLFLRIVIVSIPGQVTALNAGLSEAKGEIIAITDDDCAPHPDWLQRMENHFSANPHVGGVGGRDWQLDERGDRNIVGKVQWFGRVIGNHHLGSGEPREVDVLKGANMGYRRSAIEGIRFDERLLGVGAQAHNDMGFSLRVKQAGWKLIYDPAVSMDHFPAKRFDVDQNLRGIFNAEGIYNSAYNETLILLGYFPKRRIVAFIVWAFLIGTWGQPGPLQVPRLLARREKNILIRLYATLAGRLRAIKTVAHGKG